MQQHTGQLVPEPLPQAAIHHGVGGSHRTGSATSPTFPVTASIIDFRSWAVRNVYKVLLTRGLRGVLLHSTDPETQRFLETLIG